MNKLSSKVENEKNKETKETSEAESLKNYEEFQNAEENAEEDWLSENGMPPITIQSPRAFSESECETLESSMRDSLAERKELLKEKWFTITGKKPRNIPVMRVTSKENPEGFEFFGERKPFEIVKKRYDKILIAAKKMEALKIQYGKVRKEIRLHSLGQGVMCVKFSNDGNSLAFSQRDGVVEIRAIATNKLICSLKAAEQNLVLPIRSLVFHSEDTEKLYTGGDCGVIRVYNVTTGALITAKENFDLINVMDINMDGNFLATGGREGKICVVDTHTLQLIWTKGCSDLDKSTEPSVNDYYHRMRIYGLKFHPTEAQLFATGGWDNVVKIWDVRVPYAIRSLCGPAIYGCGLDITDNLLLTASWRAENSLSLWDFSSGHLIKNIPIKNKSIKMEGEFLYTAKFFKNNVPLVNNGMIAVGGSGFPEMIIINIFTETVEKYFPSYKPVLTLDIFQNLVAYGGKESVVRIAEITGPASRR